MPTNLGNGVFQSDGTLNDTQVAVKDAPDGGTVIIGPNSGGTFTWTGQLQVNGGTYSDGSPKGKSVNLFGAGLSGGVPTTNIINDWVGPGPFNNNQLIDVQTSPNFTMEVKWLAFTEGSLLSGKGSNGNMHFLVTNRGNFGIGSQPANYGKIMILHDCTLANSGNMSYLARFSTPLGGLCYNTTWTSAGSGSADGISLFGADGYKSASTLGALDSTGLNNFYVEDSTFSGWGNGFALDISDGARAVIRHCTFNNSLVGTHGQEASPYGLRHFEVYSCTFQNAGASTPYVWMSIRGGTFAVYSNTFGALPSGNNTSCVLECIALQRKSTFLSCPTAYPIPRQIGQGWSGGSGSYSYPQYPTDGGGYILDPAYFWNNTNTPTNLYGWVDDTDTCGNGLHASSFIQLNRDFYSGSAKPGYTAFSYPHPLRNSPNTVSVPNCVGSTEAAADTLITNAGLVIGADAFQSGGTAGNVVSQVPAAGTTVALGSTVTLTISQGATNVATPNCVGLTEAQADTAITGTSPALVVGNDVFVPSSTVAAGSVISQAPAASTVVPGGTKVDLTISTGPSTTAVWQLLQANMAGATAATSLAVAFTKANTAGNLLVAMIGIGPQSVTSVSDPTNGNWTYGGTTATNTGNCSVTIYYKANCAGAGPLTVTLNISATGYPDMCIAEFTPNSSTQDTAATVTGNSTAAAGTAVNGAPIVTRDVNDLVLAVFKGADQTGNFTAGPGIQTIGANRSTWCGFIVDPVAGTASQPAVTYTPSTTPNATAYGQFAAVTYAFVPPNVTVGNYLGLLEPAADAAVVSGGLTLGADVFASSLKGYVIAQSPAPGAVVPSGTVVTLTIYSGTA